MAVCNRPSVIDHFTPFISQIVVPLFVNGVKWSITDWAGQLQNRGTYDYLLAAGFRGHENGFRGHRLIRRILRGDGIEVLLCMSCQMDS